MAPESTISSTKMLIGPLKHKKEHSMKNLFKYIVAAATIVLAASCAREISNESMPDFTRKYKLSIDQPTKTVLSGTGSKRQVKWNDGDEIKYYTYSGQSSASSATVNTDGSGAWVEIPRGRTDEFINAVYGAAQLSSSSTENIMYVTSPVKNAQRFTSFAEAHVCAAFSDDIENPELQFHNAAAVMKFTSSASVHKVVFRGNNNEVITGGSDGYLKITYSGGALTTEAASASGTSVTVATNGEASDFYFAVLPVSFAGGITVDCYDADNSLIFSKKAGGPINTVSGSGSVKVLNLGSVEDWIASAPPTAIDLGLSVKWASFNVGATKPEEYGDYFAWGETAPKGEYKWAGYSYGTSKNGPFSKYVLDPTYGTVDHKTVLDLTDDAAHAAWGEDWRMPTKEEVAELMNTSNCTWTWTTKNGVPGYKVTSRKSGYTANSIFLPANGMKSGSSLSDGGTAGNYWTSSISGDYPYYAISPLFNSSSKNSDNCYRYFGLGIRPVQSAVVPVSSITIPETLDLIAGRSATLSATISPSNATYKGITWASSDESIATVTNHGKVTAVSIGHATITVYSADTATTAACEVTVYQLAQSVTLDKTKLEMYIGGNPVTLNATILPSEYTIKDLNWESSDSSIAIVDSEGKVTAVSAGTTKISALTTDGSNVSAACLVKVHLDLSMPATVEAVDLGLPSGLKWATMNIGAIKPEDYGEYFGWGETTPKWDYDWSTYKFELGTGSDGPFSKYVLDSAYGTIDHKTVLDLADDAAHAAWKDNWRMPTKEEVAELMNRSNCTWTWTKINGVPGYKVTSRKSGYTANSIFLPANGMKNGSSLYDAGSIGYFWSSSLQTEVQNDAWYTYFRSNDVNKSVYFRYKGLPIRPVYGAIVPVARIDVTTELELGVGTAAPLSASVQPANATYKNVTWSSSDESIATVDANGNVIGVSTGKATIIVYSADASITAACMVTVKKDLSMDLGLPSGLKWASCNVGAAKPEDYGAYFAWGETQPKESYVYSTYKWCNGDSNKLTKYCTISSYWDSTEPMDNKTTLDLNDDAAHVNWGGSWRMPTDAEWTELVNNCTWMWTTQNGVNGRLVTSKTNSNSIFLPAAGSRWSSRLDYPGSSADYWSSSLSSGAGYARKVSFDSDNVYRPSDYRCSGNSVRPVSD